MPFKSEINLLFLHKFANTARFAGEKKISANVCFLLLLEEKITAAAESRGAG